MSRTALRTATLSFLVSQGATLNVYWDAINTGVHLFALQEFGSSGGSRRSGGTLRKRECDTRRQ